MKVLIVSNSDIKGGAARSCYRLHQRFQSRGVASQMLVQKKDSDNKAVIGRASGSGIGQAISGLRQTLDHLPLKSYVSRSSSIFSPHWLPSKIRSDITKLDPDIINLHWVSAGYLQIEEITRFNKPIVWTLHDMWAFTGGCHYSGECNGYVSSCGVCPQLGSQREYDLSRWVWKRKNKAWKNLNLTIVTPSKWLAKCASSSSLFKNLRVEVIPNGLDINTYRPIDKKLARHLLNLPQDKKLILFGSLGATSDKRKGFHLLQAALQELYKSTWRDELEVVIFGASLPNNPPDFGFKAHYLGTFKDDLSLAIVYSAADVFVLPSTQENLANTVMEALACGVPSVAFNIGGMSDMIEHEKNGYLVNPYKVDELAQGIVWTIENQEKYQKLSDFARQKVKQEFTVEIQAHRYSYLFDEIITNLTKYQ